MVVIVTGYALFATSQYCIKFTFPIQRLAKFVDTLYSIHALSLVIVV